MAPTTADCARPYYGAAMQLPEHAADGRWQGLVFGRDCEEQERTVCLFPPCHGGERRCAFRCTFKQKGSADEKRGKRSNTRGMKGWESVDVKSEEGGGGEVFPF